MSSDTEDFGSRFAETWTMLQAYLGDLDAQELKSLEGKGLEQSLHLIRNQPAVGQVPDLQAHARQGPEALAIAILRERLEALEVTSEGQETWGARFLARWRELGGPISFLRYDQIQRLKAADREEAARIFKPSLTLGGYSMAQRVKTGEPEEVAELVLQNLHLRQLASIFAWWPLY
jgi:hypothetical protein